MNDRETRRTGPEAGFSLLEVMIASMILFTIIAIAAQFIGTSTKLLATKSSQESSDRSAAQVADEIAKLMRNGAISSLRTYYYQAAVAPPATNFPEGGLYTSIAWRNVEDNDGNPTYGEGYYIFPAVDESNYTDNIDNDKDSRTDEVCIRIYKVPKADFTNSLTMPATPNKDPNAWSNYVASYYVNSRKLSDIRWYNTLPAYPPPPNSALPGIQFFRTGNVITIRVVVLKYDPATKQQFSQQAEATVKMRN